MKYYKRVNGQGKTTTVESYSHSMPVEGAIEIEKAEFDNYIASLPEPDIPPERNALAELDKLTTELKSKGVIE